MVLAAWARRSSVDGSAGRRLTSRPTGSGPSRRTTNSRTVADAASSHWMSSMAISTGPSAASLATKERVPAAIARSSAGRSPGSRRRRATSSAWRCGGGSASHASLGTVCNRSESAACVSVASDGPCRLARTRNPAASARRSASRNNVVLPIPASPSISRALNRSRKSARNRSIAASSASRPTISRGACVTSTRGPLSRHRPGHSAETGFDRPLYVPCSARPVGAEFIGRRRYAPLWLNEGEIGTA